MTEGFMEFHSHHIAEMLEMEYEYRRAYFLEIDVEVIDEFNVRVTVIGNSTQRSYSFNALSDFEKYRGNYRDIDVMASRKLFEDITEDASAKLIIK